MADRVWLGGLYRALPFRRDGGGDPGCSTWPGIGLLTSRHLSCARDKSSRYSVEIANRGYLTSGKQKGEYLVLEQEIADIRTGIKNGRFVNEAAVSQGIVLRLLHALGWPRYDPQIIWPEFALRGYRVDFALCHPAGKPSALIEVKQVGKSEGAELQLFEYAFHAGVPMAVLTDGQEWNFFLPGGQGNYGERRIYKLDIVERELSECAARLRRYLAYEGIVSGAALRAARDDYDNVSKDRQMLATLPKAWSQIIDDEDEMLLEIVADRVENLCGFKPSPDMIARFLKANVASVNAMATFPYRRNMPPAPTAPEMMPTQMMSVAPQPQAMKNGIGQIGYTIDGKSMRRATRLMS